MKKTIVILLALFFLPSSAWAEASVPPIGAISRISDTGMIEGWVVDPDDANQAVTIRVYIDSTSGSPQLTAKAEASNQYVGPHGFSVAIPNEYKDNASHSVTIKAVDLSDTSGNSDTTLDGSGIRFTLVLPPVEPPVNTGDDGGGGAYTPPVNTTTSSGGGSSSGSSSSSGGSSGNRSNSRSSSVSSGLTTSNTNYINSTVFIYVLARGSKGGDVANLQKILVAQGFLSASDQTGYFGPITENAVKQLQKKYGVVSFGDPITTGYGSVGPQTRVILNSLASSSGILGSTSTTQSVTTGTSAVAIKQQIWNHLKLGSENSEVKLLQQALIKEGALSAQYATGYFGPITENAVKQLQKKYGIVSFGSPATTGYGAVGPMTRQIVNIILAR